MSKRLSHLEIKALLLAREAILTSRVDERVIEDVFGERTPGLSHFKKLIKQGLILETIEDEIDLDGQPFQFTPTFELTPDGESVLNRILVENPFIR